MDAQLSFRRLEVFRLVVAERSVTRAAEVLLVAQPAVSAQLRALEAWVGAKLFVRQGNRLVLTEAGEQTDRWAREVLAGAAQIRRDVGNLADGHTGRVIIAASMAVGTYLLPPIVALLSRQRPHADITVTISAPGEAVDAVENGECDFAVLNWDHRPLPDTVTTEHLATRSLGFYATPALLGPTASLSAKEALALPLIGAPPHVAYQRSLIEQIRQAGFAEPHFVLRLGHAEAMKSAAIANNWALIAPHYAVQDEVTREQLRHLIVDELSLDERIIVLSHRDKHFSPLQTAALGSVRQAFDAGDKPASRPGDLT